MKLFSPKAQLKKWLPDTAYLYLKSLKKRWERKQLASLPLFSINELKQMLVHTLLVKPGDIVVIHSSIEALALQGNPLQVLDLLQELVGKEGTLVFPTHIATTAREYAQKKELFDTRKTVSHTGILSEVARRQKHAVRSLHPFNSVCALGKEAKMLCSEHSNPHPCGPNTPYAKVIQKKGKVLGLGVSSDFLSLIHCVEDAMPNLYPLQTRESSLTPFSCKDKEGKPCTIEAYLPHPNIQNRHIPRYLKQHFSPEIAFDRVYKKRKFFYCEAASFFDRATKLALMGITPYK